MMMTAASPRLANIVLRHKGRFVSDLVFGVAVLAASIVSGASVGIAVSAASPGDAATTHVAQR